MPEKPDIERAVSQPASSHSHYPGHDQDEKGRPGQRPKRGHHRKLGQLFGLGTQFFSRKHPQELHGKAEQNEAERDDHRGDGQFGPAGEVLAGVAFQSRGRHVEPVHDRAEYNHASGDEDPELVVTNAAKEQQNQRGHDSDDDFQEEHAPFVCRFIGTLNKLLGYEASVAIGLTDAIRIVMRGGVPMTPVEVRNRLKAIGFDVSKYVNDLAAVHTILKRLNDSGELRFIPREAGKHQYTLNRAAVPIVLSKDIVKAMYENAAERDAADAVEEPDPLLPRRRRVVAPSSKGRRSNR